MAEPATVFSWGTTRPNRTNARELVRLGRAEGRTCCTTLDGTSYEVQEPEVGISSAANPLKTFSVSRETLFS